MKIAQVHHYGSPDVLHIEEKEIPEPGVNQILVKVVASSVTRADTMIRKGEPKFGRLFLGLTKPKKPAVGTGFSGEVVARGAEVSNFQIGEEVFGELLFSQGTAAEFLCISIDEVVFHKPAGISHSEAAVICDGFVTSYNFLFKIGQLKKGQHILINGASGSLGSAAVQLAKYAGARVTAVCSMSNFEMVRKLGADTLIDYRMSSYWEVADLCDVVYDAVGLSSYFQANKVLKTTGVYLSPVLTFSTLMGSVFRSSKVKFAATGLLKYPELRDMLERIILLFQQGELKSVIQEEFPLERIQEAHRLVDTGHKSGNVVLNISR
ncbi:MAG: NAD(P)-dependent alcohol dehydrogenase [Flavobacteriaceae bacterium]